MRDKARGNSVRGGMGMGMGCGIGWGFLIQGCKDKRQKISFFSAKMLVLLLVLGLKTLVIY